MAAAHHAQLGCGLIAIGRPWGTTPKVPTEKEAIHFLEVAFENGIRLFDTAPSYGLSEERLGKFLSLLTPAERKEVKVYTKFGERWNSSTNESYVDHSLDSLKQSLDFSLKQFSTIDCLQIHKTSLSLLNSSTLPELLNFIENTKSINSTGVSISDKFTGIEALKHPCIRSLQLPYNRASTQFAPLVQACVAQQKQLIVNRPFQMGNININEESTKIDAFRFILSEVAASDYILTGTANPQHLVENLQAFNKAYPARH